MNRLSWVAFALALIVSVFASADEAVAQSEIQKLTETLVNLRFLDIQALMLPRAQHALADFLNDSFLLIR